jgi:hypothetical protein
LFQEIILDSRRGNFVKPGFPEPGKEVGGQMAAVLGYGLGFQGIALGLPAFKMGRAPGKHIPGKPGHGYVPGPGAPGGSLALLLLEVDNQGHGAGFRIGFCLGVVVGGKFPGKMLKAPAIPIFTHTIRKPAGRVKGEPERFGICPTNEGIRFGVPSHGILFLYKRIKYR